MVLYLFNPSPNNLAWEDWLEGNGFNEDSDFIINGEGYERWKTTRVLR